MKKLSIIVNTIKSPDQRYCTAGDWTWHDAKLRVMVTQQDKIDWTFLLAIHEIIEAYLCWKSGIAEHVVTEFDMLFERRKKKRMHAEPGDHPKSPYRRQHQLAAKVEKLLAQELGVDWREYEKGLK